MNHRVESVDHYQQALKAGRKAHRQSVQQGKCPFLQVLDEILTSGMISGEYNLGLIEIPTDRIIGTKNIGRTNAFASNFMPLLSSDSEFGEKWRKLCEAHLGDEGIRDPITCYEFLGRFYVLEGNKRVSVLKYFGAITIPGNVIRIMPRESNSPEVMAYREFLEYYPQTKLYQIYFTRLGSFRKLQVALGFEPEHVWTDTDRRSFLSGYFYFESVFQKLGGDALSATAADALLEWLKVYSFPTLKTLSSEDLSHSLEAIWSDIKTIGQTNVIEVATEFEVCDEKTFKTRRAFSMMPSYLNIAFIHELKPENSNWVRAHEAGRKYLEEVMGDQVIVQRFVGVGSGTEAETAMETAIKNGADVIFATTVPLIAACRKTAALHPYVKIFNCSVSMPYSDVRTYYGRIFEGKFISGAIAGAISKNDHIGYIASYPIFGVPAGINAFALGAQLTNPDAKIHLKWSCVEGQPLAELKDMGIEVVSTLDIPMPGWNEGQWGTFRMKPDGSTELIASPYWNWGTFYVQFARGILGGNRDGHLFSKHENRAINYWWGMSSGVIGVEWTDAIPAGTKALAKLLKNGIVNGSIDPFHRCVISQDGVLRNDGNTVFSPEEILNMDWLCDNVIGAIPEYSALAEKARSLVRLQGIYRDSIPPQKESVLL